MTPTAVRTSTCTYCGGTLDPRYHFCIHCAAVYREADEAVYGETPPPPQSLETRIVEKAGSAWKFFCIIAIGLTVLGAVGQMLGAERIALALALQELFLLVVTVGYAVYHWRDIAPVFSSFELGWAALASFPILAGCLAVNKVYHDFLARLFDIDAGQALAPLFDNLSGPALVFSICVFPAIVEEIGFRGVVQERMVRAVGPLLGFAATSVLFTALHFSIFSAPYLFGLSMFFCWVRARTRTIYLPMVLHFLHNFVVLVVFYGAEI